jgi:NADPH:quinone reductase-like Zn-dependent oxidoreductase
VIEYTSFGGPEVLRLVRATKPTPKDDEVLIRVHATTVSAADGLVRSGRPLWGRLILGFRTPRRPVIGTELAGEIEAVGKNVRRFAPGDQVYGFTGFKLGAYAEYTCLPERASLAKKPANTSYEEAAALVDGASTALFFLRGKAKLARGQRVLVNGASGSIGTYAVQLAKHFGAEVVGVCSARNAELVRSLGADRVIDYGSEDFTRERGAYDVIFDTVDKSPFLRARHALAPKGVYVTTGLTLSIVFHELWTSIARGRRAVWGMSVEKTALLEEIRELVETGTIRALIDKRFTLEEMVEAHRYVDTGRKRGNVTVAL